MNQTKTRQWVVHCALPPCLQFGQMTFGRCHVSSGIRIGYLQAQGAVRRARAFGGVGGCLSRRAAFLVSSQSEQGDTAARRLVLQIDCQSKMFVGRCVLAGAEAQPVAAQSEPCGTLGEACRNLLVFGVYRSALAILACRGMPSHVL